MTERVRLACGCIAKGFTEEEARIIERIHLGEKVDGLLQTHPLPGGDEEEGW